MFSIFPNTNSPVIVKKPFREFAPEKIVVAEPAEVNELADVFVRVVSLDRLARDLRLLFQRHGGSKNF